MALVAVGAAVFAFTPLNDDRHPAPLARPEQLDPLQPRHSRPSTPRSNRPIVGWGTTRSALGSPTSIAIGKTPACPTCGNAPIGSTGEIWAVLIANGFVGAGLFVALPAARRLPLSTRSDRPKG